MENKLYLLQVYDGAEFSIPIGIFDDSKIDEVDRICIVDSKYHYEELTINNIPVVPAYKITGIVVPDKQRRPVVDCRTEPVVVDKDTDMDVLDNSTVYTRDLGKVKEYEDSVKSMQEEIVKNTQESYIQHVFDAYIPLIDLFTDDIDHGIPDACPVVSLTLPLLKNTLMGGYHKS